MWKVAFGHVFRRFGFAERLEDDIVQITNVALFAFGDFSQWDIVRINESHPHAYPFIEEILEIRLPCRPILSFDDPVQLDALRNKLASSGAQVFVLLKPTNHLPGLLTVVHPREIALQFRERDPECCDLLDDDDEDSGLEEWRGLLAKAALGTAADAIKSSDKETAASAG